MNDRERQDLRYGGERKRGVPLWVVLRGYLPKMLGGRPAYDWVFENNPFGNDEYLISYLEGSIIVAIAVNATEHEMQLQRMIKAVNDRNPQWAIAE